MERRTLSELRAEAPLHAGALTIVPLAELYVAVSSDGVRLLASARKRPAGVVILGEGGVWALDEVGRPDDLEEIKSRAKGLEEILG